MSLSAEHLSFGHARGRDVLRDVTLRVDAGEVVGLMGLNGAGKSTLVRVLLGLLRPRAGRVSLGGQPLASLTATARARALAALLQNEETPFGYRVLDVVRMGRYARERGPNDATDDATDDATTDATAAHQTSEEKVRHALALADAAHLADRFITELSGGERQRVLLARALAQESRYLLLDEPTAALDLSHQHAVAALLCERARGQGVGVVWALHDLNLALGYCDRVCVLDGGRIARDDVPARALAADVLREIFGIEGEIAHDRAGRPHALITGRVTQPRPRGIDA